MKKIKQEVIIEMIKLHKNGLNTKQISEKLGVFRKTIAKYLRQNGCEYSKCNKAKINSDIFQKIDTEEKAYWLGFLYADGCIMDRDIVELSLQFGDLEHLKKFANFLEFKGKIYKKKFSHQLSFKDSFISNSLRKLGCVERKSLILKFPSYNQVPEELMNHFIRGYFEGDGYIRKEGSIEISILGTEEFLKSFIKYLNIQLTIKKTRSKAFLVSLCGNNARKLAKIMYENCTIFLERKYEIYDKERRYKFKITETD